MLIYKSKMEDDEEIKASTCLNFPSEPNSECDSDISEEEIPRHKLVTFLQRMGDRRISSASAGYSELGSSPYNKRGSLAQALDNSILRRDSAFGRIIQGRRKSWSSDREKGGSSGSLIETVKKLLPINSMNDGYR